MKNFYQKNKEEIILFASFVLLIVIVSLVASTCNQPAPYPGTTTTEIKQEVKEKIQPVDHKIDSLEKERKELVKVAKTLSEKLLLAQYENKRLREGVTNSQAAPLQTNSESQDITLQEISTAAATSDSICNEVINNLQDQLINSDSVSFQKDIKITTYKTGFEKMGEVAERAQYDLKIANKKLKRKTFWGKVKDGVIIGFLVKTGIDILKK